MSEFNAFLTSTIGESLRLVHWFTLVTCNCRRLAERCTSNILVSLRNLRRNASMLVVKVSFRVAQEEI